MLKGDNPSKYTFKNEHKQNWRINKVNEFYENIFFHCFMWQLKKYIINVIIINEYNPLVGAPHLWPCANINLVNNHLQSSRKLNVLVPDLLTLNNDDPVQYLDMYQIKKV